MFTLELDLVMTFAPFMEERGPGISLTRRFELPFAPFEGLSISGSQLDDCPEPPGFALKDVVWDIDRQVARQSALPPTRITMALAVVRVD